MSPTQYLQRWGDTISRNVDIGVDPSVTVQEVFRVDAPSPRVWVVQAIAVITAAAATLTLDLFSGVGSTQVQRTVALVVGSTVVTDLPGQTVSGRLTITPLAVGLVSASIIIAPFFPLELSNE